ncbi:MAG: preprotein translocase subunit SecG [Micavibrio aeruginosavorus]|uniref:Protein-export membrane protein SecG n=1 Tax=Micavibrio aeruginosavorus TaxID=349221 RepID=A0A2W5MXI6_9BACT|nr:MAG: preprotein translocase subunit SecG [Micavibrio aeruginosavorus]
MENVILVIHLILALAIIGLVLLQRSEGGGLGIGGGGGGMGGLATAGQTANALTRATGICAGLFFTTSIILAILAGTHHQSGSVLDSLDKTPAPVAAPAQNPDGSKPTSTPTNDHVDEAPVKLDSDAANSDKEVPKASDNPEPQTGAPSAPISQ